MEPELFETELAADAMPDVALTVAELAQQISQVVGSDPILSDVPVRGEISNWKEAASGHCYFTLKDDFAQVRCCLWRQSAQQLRFKPRDGDGVIANGRIEWYGKRGELNFIIENLRFDGAGALFENLERLKTQLAGEGCFDAERKKPLPPLPRRIGIITSPTGAVAHDITTVLTRRWPLATLVFIPAKVQGFDAAEDLRRALTWAEIYGDLDVVIVARGGGSIEDLWCFNDEQLVRDAANFPLPLISAIGHETDYTLLDFAADVRAPTPSVAAEIVAPDVRELAAAIGGQRARLVRAVGGPVKAYRQRLNWTKARPGLKHPREKIARARTEVARLGTRVRDASLRRVKIERRLLAAHRAQLHALDPQRVLERGYALLLDENGALITQVAQLKTGQNVRAQLADGSANLRVEDGVEIEHEKK